MPTYKITKTSITTLNNAEYDEMFNMVYNRKNDDVHYLAFDRHLFGFCPTACFLYNYNQDDCIASHEEEIMKAAINTQQVVSLYPFAKFSVYPITNPVNCEYKINEDYEHHFSDILYLNDKVYKTKYLYIDYSDMPTNFDFDKIVKLLTKMINKSKVLEAIYIDQVVIKDL